MKNPSLRDHLVTFLLILIVSFLLFTFFPGLFPHPEDFSPYVYVVAFLACIEVWFLVKGSKRRWLLVPVLLICLLALLDETGYGSEVMDIAPIYSQTLHAEIRDLHNLIGIAVELGSLALEEAHWNGNLFVGFLALDGFLLAAGFLLGWLLRFRLPRNEKSVRQRTAWLMALFWFASGLAASLYLLILPRDPKNALFLGYSATRLFSVAVAFLVSSTPIAILVAQRKKRQVQTKAFSNWLDKHNRTLFVVSIALILISLAYQIYAPFVFLPDEQTRLERVTPLMLWLLAVAWFALLGALAWRGGLRRPISGLFGRLVNFLRREPAYFYTTCAVVLILIAQLIDRSVIPLNTLIHTPNFQVKLWGLWTEEIFEMNGAFLFIVAAFYFPKTK